jgi:hypothetical protein
VSDRDVNGDIPSFLRRQLEDYTVLHLALRRGASGGCPH